MPLYRITAPNGQTYQIEGPPGASDADVANAVMAQYPESGQAPKQSTIGSELVRGGKQLVSSARTGLESILSPEEAAKAGVARGEAIGKEAGEGVSFEQVKKAYQDKGLLSAAGEAASQIPRALAGQGANLASMAGGARLGAMAGSAFGPAGTLVGGALGAGATLLPQFMGSNVERQASEQMEKGEPVKIDRTQAYSAAAGQALLEGAGTAFTLGKRVVKGVLGVADDAALITAKSQAELVKAAERSLAASAGRGAIRGTAEMPVEVAQQVLERAQAGLDLTSPDAIKEYGESAYQAILIGGPLGAAGNVVGRGQAKTQLEQQQQLAEQQRIASQGPQVAPEAPIGTQGTLFSEAEMGEIVPPEAAPPAPPAAAQKAEQLDLGIDFQREYADIVKEREALKLQPKTPEVTARIKDLNDQLLSYSASEVASIRAEKAAEAEARAKFPAIANAPEPAQQSLFPEIDVIRPEPVAAAEEAEQAERKPVGQTRLPLRDVPEGKDVQRDLPIPARPTEITMQDLEDIGVPMRTSKKWLEQNVLGKTPAEIQVLVGNNPDLLLGTGSRAQILKYLTAPVPEGFKEEPRVTTPTQTNKPKPVNQPRGSKPSVGVSGKPAVPNVVQPGARVSTAAGAPATPDGRGLAPAGQPAGKRATPQRAQPATVTPYEDGKAQAAQGWSIDTNPHKAGTTESQQWANGWLDTKYPTTKPNAPATTTPATKPAAPAVSAAKPAVVVKPAAKAAPAKKPEAPAPAVAAETVEEEAARKAEAEAMRKAMEAPAAKPTPKAAPAPAPKAEKPEPKELPEKLREPVGTTEFGAKEGEKEILRGPQGMLFPMSKREEIAYAERKDATPKEAAEEPTAKDDRQAELDLQDRIPDNVQEKANRLKGTVAYHGPEGSIIRTYESRTGESIYIPLSADKADYFTKGMFGGALDIGSIRGDVTKVFTQKDFDALKAEVAKLKQQDAADAAKYPDGPFTGATTNVVAGDSIDPRYTNYLTELMQSLGLGDVRVFLYHGKDVKGRGDELHLHGDYYPILSRAEPDKGQNGATKPVGPTGKDFMLFVNDNMSEARTLEVIAHELGHMIQAISYDKAPANVKTAIKNEYNDWVDSLKGKKLADLVASLRNRYTVEEMESKGITDVEIKKMGLGDLNYWMGFDEWFADNVSRWATTADKPLTITEKFFSKVAQMMRDLVALVTGRKFPPNKKVAEFIDAMGPGSADMWMATANPTGATKVQPLQNAVSYTTQQLVDSMGPLDATQKNGLQKLITGVQANPDIDYVTKARTQVADIAATIEQRLRTKFDGAVRDSMGKLNPMGLYRQAQDYSKMLLEYFQNGTLYKDPVTGLWKSKVGAGVRAPSEIYTSLDKYAEKNGYSRERATQIASRVLEGVRLNEMRASNKTGATSFSLHLNDAQIDQLMAEYNADPDLKAMSKLMDEARIDMVDNLVKVGRLSPEQGAEWKSVVGYVPFDRIEDFATNFNKAKKISGKGIAQLGKLPELIGSEVRPVGNVFDNYINTLGWMVGQTLKTDATVNTLRSLENLGFAKYLGRSALSKPNAVGAYVNGEMYYWNLPSKYDVMAFKDLNPPKAGWLRAMGQFSNMLRKTVTVLPPFALKQVTDDVQRAILTSGVKNPFALIRMSLTNFPKLAFAELRGIQHPMVREFGKLGLTGEYDFEAGKPATSLLKDLGFKKRSRFEELVHRLDGITRASDLAVRKAIYDQTLKESKDELMAQTRAREFINFRRRGANDFVGAMVTTIPFFNAYIQGMDVLYRAASGKDSSSSVDRAQARQMFWSRASTVMMLSSLYALGKDDEDKDYLEMDLRTRDSNWILPGGYKLPVPGELGAVFKVIPERIVEYMKRQGTPEEQSAWDATRTTLAYMYEQYLGRAVPVPQAIKPVIEAWSNKSFLTGRDLEGYHHRAMDPSARVTEQTSELAKAIAVFSRDQIGVEVSPIMIDNALRGYFGSTAALLTMTTDSLLNPTRIDRPLHKYALLSNYLYDPVGTRRMTEFYEEREKVGRANATLRELMKVDLDKAAEYAEKNADKLMLESAVNSTLEQLERTRAYKKYINSPLGAQDMSNEEREAQIKEIRQMEVELTSWLREAKVAIRQ